ncbi:MAG: hypothetical protein L0Z55_11255, partial [Planctomycetes bacterium]|nr:hypothetical protein [Planctomycetota bacterium]
MNDKVFAGILIALIAGWIGTYVFVISEKRTLAEDEATKLEKKVRDLRKYATGSEPVPTSALVEARRAERADIEKSVQAAKAIFRERDAKFGEFLPGAGANPELGRWISLFADDFAKLEKDYVASLGDVPPPEKLPFKRPPDPKDPAELPQAQKNWTIQKTLI